MATYIRGIWSLRSYQVEPSRGSREAEACPSFWIQCPRPLEDLLLVPKLPQVDLHLAQPDAVRAWLNDWQIPDKRDAAKLAIASELRLRTGWNHFLLKLTQTNDRLEFAAYFTPSQPEFLSQLDFSLEMP
jgi:hypothetical protein